MKEDTSFGVLANYLHEYLASAVAQDQLIFIKMKK